MGRELEISQGLPNNPTSVGKSSSGLTSISQLWCCEVRPPLKRPMIVHIHYGLCEVLPMSSQFSLFPKFFHSKTLTSSVAGQQDAGVVPEVGTDADLMVSAGCC